MKGNQFMGWLQRKFIGITCAIILLMVSGNAFAQSDLVVTGTLTIPSGTVLTVNNLEIPKDAHLIVNGKLKVLGSLTMSHNNAQFTMGDSAYVIIDGNFTAQNQVVISVSSFLIVQGDFTKSGSTTQGDLIVEGGNIYIFGTVDNWGGTDFTTCGDYEGDTGAIGGETCDYGTEDDFEDNYEDFPQDLIDLINCFDLSNLSNVKTCMGASAVFSVKADANATFRWQLQNADDSWSNISALNLPGITISGSVLTIGEVTPSLAGSRIRVVASATPQSVKPCSVSVSRTVVLSINHEFIWTGTNSNLWKDPLNWSCKTLPTTDSNVKIPISTVYPLIDAATIGETNDLTLDPNARLEVMGTLKIAGALTGTMNAQKGSLEFNGRFPQTIPSNAFTPARIGNLRINNPSQVILDASLELSGILSLNQGNLKINGQVTLISDANGTALISGAGTGKITGLLTMQRYLNPAYGYKYFSSPFKGTTVADFEPFMELKDPTTSFPHFYSYKEDRKDGSGNDLSGWEEYTNPSNPLNFLEGYALNFGTAGGAVIIALSGEVNNGPQTRTLSNHNGTYTGGFHLVGNPYPSPIDWNNAAAWTKNNIDDAIYFFSASATDPYTGTYSSYVENGPSTDGKTTNIIPSMQGFFVHVSEGSTQGILGTTNAARVDDFSQEFHKSFQEKKISLLRISAGFEGEEKMDPTVIYFDYKASASFDRQLDAYKLMNTHQDVPSFYSLTPEKEELSINAIASSLPQDLLRVPMGYRALRSGNLSLQIQDLDLPSGIHVYLVDLEKELYVDLLKEKAYTTPVGKGGSNSRFEIVLSEKAISEPAKLLNTPMSVYGSKEKLTVTLNLDLKGSSEITVSTLSGQVLESVSTSSSKVEFEGIKSAGVYIVSLKSGETHFTKKILIK